MKRRDLLLLLVGAALLVFLWLAPPVSTHYMPRDETHKQMYDLVAKDGKKAAEAHCEECHNPEQVPFPPDHPSKNRCLLCHRLIKNGDR